MTGKELAIVLNKFLTSPQAQNARVQIEMPNGQKIRRIRNSVVGESYDW